jgi:hypothetical protein
MFNKIDDMLPYINKYEELNKLIKSKDAKKINFHAKKDALFKMNILDKNYDVVELILQSQDIIGKIIFDESVDIILQITNDTQITNLVKKYLC